MTRKKPRAQSAHRQPRGVDHEISFPPAQLSDALRADSWGLCGRFGKPHGVRGDVRLWMYNAQSDLLEPGAELFIGAHPRDGAPVELPTFKLTVQRIRFDTKGAFVSFAELNHREEAAKLNHQAWVAPRSLFSPLAEDEFYLADLIGAQGLLFPNESDGDDEGAARSLGELTGLLEAGAGEILIFESEMFGEVMVPNLDPFVISIDVEAKLVRVRAIPGLIEER